MKTAERPYHPEHKFASQFVRPVPGLLIPSISHDAGISAKPHPLLIRAMRGKKQKKDTGTRQAAGRGAAGVGGSPGQDRKRKEKSTFITVYKAENPT